MRVSRPASGEGQRALLAPAVSLKKISFLISENTQVYIITVLKEKHREPPGA